MTLHVIDAHRHVWDTISSGAPWAVGLGAEPLTYSWLDDIKRLQGSFMPQDVEFVSNGAFTLSGNVFVQAGCDQSGLHEVSYVNQLNWGASPLVGIVAHADLVNPQAAREVQLLAAEPHVVGVRYLLQGQPHEVFTSAALDAGLKAVAVAGLTFDACITHDQLPWLTDLVARHPDLTFILDHVGKPPITAHHEQGQDPVTSTWFTDLSALARAPHVNVKLSGLAAEASPALVARDWCETALPYLVSALELFGADRCMFGSDWPVSHAQFDPELTYLSWLHTVFDDALGAASPSERAAVAHQTALHRYGISMPSAPASDTNSEPSPEPKLDSSPQTSKTP